MSRKRSRSDQTTTDHQAKIKNKPQEPNFQTKIIKPLTENQHKTFDSYYSGKNLLLIGSAGTGKSFLSLYLALNDVLIKDPQYDKVTIIRSAVSSRDIGFLPGSAKEKLKAYELPYKQICSDLLQKGDGYEILQRKNIVEFESTSFLRGITFNNSIIFVDEIQNMNLAELKTIITRIGKNCKLILAGDYAQSDMIQKHSRDDSKNDVLKFIDVISTMKSFDIVRFTTTDIVRSGLVKEFLIQTEKLGYA
jgi:phosphate starvation-inducible PhoH-like protein